MTILDEKYCVFHSHLSISKSQRKLPATVHHKVKPSRSTGAMLASVGC